MTETRQTSSSAVRGLVVERRGDRLLVLPDTEENNLPNVVQCSQHATLVQEKAVVGDKVLLDMDRQTVLSIEGRRNLLQRPSVSSRNKLQMKSIASNIDAMLLVIAVVPFAPSIAIDRFLVAAHELNIPKSFIVVNKMDLPKSAHYLQSLSYYNALGYPVIGASTIYDKGLEGVKNLLSGKTCVFVGQSGVGKSSIISSLLPNEEIYIGELGGQKNNVGTHTTSNAKLYHLTSTSSHTAAIIDSPGIRELGTWHISRKSIIDSFQEIKLTSQKCKFRNCSHSEAEGKHGFCAVQNAVLSGDVHRDRLRSFLSLMKT